MLVRVSTVWGTAADVCEAANAMQTGAMFVPRAAWDADRVAVKGPDVRIGPGTMRRPFSVSREWGVFVCSHRVEERAKQSGLPSVLVVLTAAATGLVQWEALQCQPELVAEDFLYPGPRGCVFGQGGSGPPVPPRVQLPWVSPNARAFYVQCGCCASLAVLDGILNAASEATRRNRYGGEGIDPRTGLAGSADLWYSPNSKRGRD